MAQTNKTEPRVKSLRITVAAPDIQQALTKLKSMAEQMSQINVNVRELVDKAISVAAKFGAVLNEVESSGKIKVEIRHREYGKRYHTINVEIESDHDVVEVEMDCYRDKYEATLRIDHYE